MGELDIMLKVLDRIISLVRLREKRMQKRFDQIWKPTYSDLQLVHADYYTMFQEAYSLISQGAKADTEAAYEEALHKAIDLVKKKRVQFAPLRQKLEALDELKRDERLFDNLSDDEREFISSVIGYIRIKSLPDAVGTRSADLQVELERMARMDQTVAENIVLTQVEERIEHLGDDWINVTDSFNKLQIGLIQQSL